MQVDELKIRRSIIKYILLTLLLSTQLFAYEKNKPITVYGYVSKKGNHYILNAYHIDGKGVKNTPFQLLFDSDETEIRHLNRRYKLKGTIKKYITYEIFKVSSIEKLNSRIKSYFYLNNYNKVRLTIGSPMRDKVEAKLTKKDIDYISNIKVTADNKLIYNINISPCLAEDPFMKFSYKNIKPHSLTLEYIDNYGKIRTNTESVKYRNTTKQIPQPLKLLVNPKSYPTQIESIKKLFGDITLIEDGIHLTAPKIAENGRSIPVRIRSNIKFKSIALFIKSGNWQSNYAHYKKLSKGVPSNGRCGEKNKFKLVSQWVNTPYSILDFDLRVTMRIGVGEVVVVLEAENGKFYTARKDIDVNISAGACG